MLIKSRTWWGGLVRGEGEGRVAGLRVELRAGVGWGWVGAGLCGVWG